MRDAVTRVYGWDGRTRGVAWVLTLAALASVLLVRPASADEPRMPAPGSRAAAVIDAETGAVLYERGSRAELAPASLTKMVTALVAVERSPLDRLVKSTHPYNVVPVLIGLEPGDSLRLEEILYGLLLDSGNDAAMAIAESVGDGSIERFVGWMNELSGRLGLANTHFRNPHGLDQQGHVSSAYDMAIIGRAVMRDPVLSEIVAQRRHEVVGPPRWVFRTRNPLLGVYDGVDGIKTGFDHDAGPCLVATASRDGRRAIAVVMNSTNYGGDAASLLDYAFDDGRWGQFREAAAPARPAGNRLAMLRADLSARAEGAPRSVLGAARAATTLATRGQT